MAARAAKKKRTSAAKKTAKKVTRAAKGAVTKAKRSVRRAATNVHATAGKARTVGQTMVTAGELIKETADFVDAVATRSRRRKKQS